MIGLLLREALDRLRVRLNMYVVIAATVNNCLAFSTVTPIQLWPKAAARQGERLTRKAKTGVMSGSRVEAQIGYKLTMRRERITPQGQDVSGTAETE